MFRAVVAAVVAAGRTIGAATATAYWATFFKKLPNSASAPVYAMELFLIA